MSYHKDIAWYIEYMRSLADWYVYEEKPNKYLWSRLWDLYTEIKWILSWISVIFISISLTHYEKFGLVEGAFLCFPFGITMAVLHTIYRFTGKQQVVLALSFNQFFLANSEPWMEEIKAKYLIPYRRHWFYFWVWLEGPTYTFILLPLTANIILHHGLGILERPIILVGPVTGFCKDTTEWDFKFYIVTVISGFIFAEEIRVLQSLAFNFSMFATFFLIELEIFTHKVKNLASVEEPEFISKLQETVDEHNNIVETSGRMKEYFGFTCAFITLITTMMLTLSMFAASDGNNIFVAISESSGIFTFILYNLALRYLGQNIENMGHDLFLAFYDLPWYRYSKRGRRDVIMMMRQARGTLTIDYYGMIPMNYASFEEAIMSSFSYFTILKSISQ